MAKKAVATFAAKAGSRSMVKCIRMDKSPKTGAYVFTELLVESGKEKEFFNKKQFSHTRYGRGCPKGHPLFASVRDWDYPLQAPFSRKLSPPLVFITLRICYICKLQANNLGISVSQAAQFPEY